MSNSVKRNNSKTIILAIVAFVLLVLVGAGIYFTLTIPTEEPVLMQDFVGLNKSEVEVWATDNGYDKQITFTEEYSEEITENIIISQSIEKDSEINEETKFEFVVSKGMNPDLEVKLIDFSDMTQDEIDAWVEANHMSDVTYEYVEDDKIEQGKFIKSNLPVDQSSAKRSDMIIITISKGAGESTTVIIPNFTGYNKTKVSNWAEANDIKVAFSTAYSETVEINYVTDQSPAANTEVEFGTTITVTISLGAPVTVESFAGWTTSEVNNWATKNNMQVTFYDYYSDTVEKDKVISNSPSSGKVTQGSAITVKRSQGKPVVDDYTGKQISNLESFVNTLNEKYNKTANIKVEKTTEYSDTVASGNIISQSVSGSVAIGTTVKVVVSKGKELTAIDLSGKTKSEINVWANENKLLISYVDGTYSNKVEKDCALSNNPNSGNVEEGATITVKLSLGKPTVSNYAGKTKNALQEHINSLNNSGAKLEVTYTEEYNTSTPAGNIISHTTGEVKVGSTIEVKVSKGSAPVSVGNYVGKKAADLSEDGLSFSISEYQYSDSVAEGLVISQSVASGTEVERGTTITVVVSKGSQPKAHFDAEFIYDNFNDAGSVDAAKGPITSYLNQLGFTNVNFSVNNSVDPQTAGNIDLSHTTGSGDYNLTDTITIGLYSGEYTE